MNKKGNRPKIDRSDPMICLCNGICLREIRDSIDKGARSVDEIGDQTSAGMGECGGSCRPKLKKILSGDFDSRKP